MITHLKKGLFLDLLLSLTQLIFSTVFLNHLMAGGGATVVGRAYFNGCWNCVRRQPKWKKEKGLLVGLET